MFYGSAPGSIDQRQFIRRTIHLSLLGSIRQATRTMIVVIERAQLYNSILLCISVKYVGLESLQTFFKSIPSLL